ncbi:MAG: hypothetical protein C0601_01380 [Candidatus Muiribacterium halophilum]|uniref:DNA helicase UvrD n=1 Tax=Muiribacterium halophilum TaxID=2053465 RepID=A0A2N5ZLF8_MUIH1|nr:MAG: hypothetical protein C0601_01380 [Candidatus Muirbacterium halophilum]
MKELFLDLHSHSGYSGGVGQITIPRIIEGMNLKGIDIFGSGDCLHLKWLETLQSEFVFDKSGVFYSKLDKEKGFILQTEVIFTFPYLKTSRRKLFHIIILFPGFESVFKTRKVMESMGVSLNIGRPFLKFDKVSHLAFFIKQIKEIDENIEFIPAHVMTPQGIFGSNNPLFHLEEMFGDSKDFIKIIETGLSADPEMLSKIEELNDINFISNSDCHSPYLYRLGREFTKVLVKDISYKSILEALKDKGRTFTYEFPPAEGKFFLTGHRKGKKGHEEKVCVFSPDYTPSDRNCPICKKKLTIGVYEQLLEIIRHQSAKGYIKRDNFKKLIPLVDVVRETLGVRSYTQKVIEQTKRLINIYGSEVLFWENYSIEDIEKLDLNDNIIRSITLIDRGDFSYFPGFDGEYGKLMIGKEIDYKQIEIR